MLSSTWPVLASRTCRVLLQLVMSLSPVGLNQAKFHEIEGCRLKLKVVGTAPSTTPEPMPVCPEPNSAATCLPSRDTAWQPAQPYTPPLVIKSTGALAPSGTRLMPR